ncbi:MAG: hypothetical protein EXS43_10390 [Opitutus sp.]|nr:hypothetical protein [Opitutus sp.]
MCWIRCVLLLGLLGGGEAALFATATDAETLLREARAAEASLDSQHALDRYLAADQLRPNNASILQKIARQYSDRIVDLKTDAEKKASAESALAYSQRAVALDPRNAVNVLSLAVSHGKLSLFADTRTKVQYSRLIREEAERALALDPHYAWSHHVLGRWNHEVSELGLAARVWVRAFYGGLPSASPAEAVRYLSRAVELEPEELAHHLELGFAFLAAGETARARAAFEHGLALPSRAKHDEPAKARARAALAAMIRNQSAS